MICRSMPGSAPNAHRSGRAGHSGFRTTPVNPQPFTRQIAKYPKSGVLFARGSIDAASLIALIESGRLDELPTLPIIVTARHRLSVVGSRVQRDAVRHDDGVGVLRRQVYVDTIGFHPTLIRASIDVLGVEHILAGSDWPIVSDGPIRDRLVQALDSASVDATGQELFASGNTKRLLGL